MPTNAKRVETFALQPGRVIGGKYVVERKLGSGWEGEVYKVLEQRTGVHRAAKLFFPHHNDRDKAVTFYAQKLERLRNCSMVIQYHHSETIRHRGDPVTCLISEYVDGELLCDFVKRHPGRRLQTFEAMHLMYALTLGLEEIHRHNEYHGDLHEANVLVKRQGVFFDLKVVDFYHWGRPTAAHRRDDVADLVRLFYESIGGQKRYASQPDVVKRICRGLRRDLIGRQFPTASKLRDHLETFVWD